MSSLSGSAKEQFGDRLIVNLGKRHVLSKRHVDAHSSVVTSVAFSPAGADRLASGSQDSTIKVWDTSTWERVATLKGHTSAVLSVAFSPKGDRLASGSQDSTIRVWDTSTWECAATVEGHTGSVQSVAFSPEGDRLASGSQDCTIRVWDTGTWECVNAVKAHAGAVFSVAFSPQGDRLVSVGHTIVVWDAVTWERVATAKGHTSAVLSVAFSPKGDRLASGSQDSTIRVWDTSTWGCAATVEGHTGSVQSVAFSPEGDRLASGSQDSTIKVWDTSTWECVNTVKAHAGAVFSVAFPPQGDRLATGSHHVKVWDMTPEFGLGAVIALVKTRNTDSMPGLLPALKELDAMVGLKDVKNQLAELVNERLRDPAGPASYVNVQLIGPPGVGKTHAAMLIGRILHACGLVQLAVDPPAEPSFVVVHMHDLIGEYVGQTELKAEAFLREHADKVLVIDDAHAWFVGGFAQEAAAAVLKFLDENRGKSCVIVVGNSNSSAAVDSGASIDYNFFALDPGLERRFPIKITFLPFTVSELVDIFKIKITKVHGWRLAPDCTVDALRALFAEHMTLFESGGAHPNARGVETLASVARRQRLQDHSRPSGELDITDVRAGLLRMSGVDVDDAVKSALKSSGAVFAPLRRAKVILCGQGRAGKTSLRKALTGEPFDSNEESTAGAHVACVMQRIDADQAAGGWEVHITGNPPEWENAAEAAYLERIYGSDDVQGAVSEWAGRFGQDKLDDEGAKSIIDAERGYSGGDVGNDQIYHDPDNMSEFEVGGAPAPFSPRDPDLPAGPAPTVQRRYSASEEKDSRAEQERKKEAFIAARIRELEAAGGDLPVKVSVWDLGGQRLFQALQQMFLTKSAIYIVTFQLTHFADDAPDADRADAEAELRFWCDTVAAVLGSGDGGDVGRVVVVGTFLDRLAPGADVHVARKRAMSVVSSTLLRGRVVEDNIFCVGCKRRGESVGQLRAVLDSHIADSRDVSEHVPLNYLKLLTHILAEGKPRITFDEVVHMAEQCGMPTADIVPLRAEVNDALQSLHRLGQLLWWRDSDILRNTVVVNPQWLITAFTAVLRDPCVHVMPWLDKELDRFEAQSTDDGSLKAKGADVAHAKAVAARLLRRSGVLSESLWNTLWPPAIGADDSAATADGGSADPDTRPCYTQGEQAMLIELMELFGLATRLTNSRTSVDAVCGTSGNVYLAGSELPAEKRHLIPSLSAVLKEGGGGNDDDDGGDDDVSELLGASLTLKSITADGTLGAVRVPYGVFTRLVGKVVWWSQKTHGQRPWAVHHNSVVAYFGAVGVRVAVAPDDSHLRVSVISLPDSVSIDPRSAVDRVVRSLNEIVRVFLGNIVYLSGEMGPSAPPTFRRWTRVGVLVCHSGDVQADRVFAEGFHDVQTVLRDDGALFLLDGTSGEAKLYSTMETVGTVVIVVSSESFRTRTKACEKHDIDLVLLQWLVALTLASRGSVKLHVIALDDVNAAVGDDIQLPRALLDKAGELVGADIASELLTPTLSGVFEALIKPTRRWTVKDADDFGVTYLVIPFERAVRPGPTVVEGRFKCPECRAVSMILEALPQQLPPEIVEDLRRNFKCSVGLAPCGGCEKNPDLPDSTDPLCVFSACGHARCCVHCAVRCSASSGAPGPVKRPSPQLGSLEELAEPVAKVLAAAGGEPGTCENVKAVELSVPPQTDADKCMVECAVFVGVKQLRATAQDDKGGPIVLKDALTMPDLPPLPSELDSVVAASATSRRVLRPISTYVLSVRRDGVHDVDTERFDPPVEVIMPHNALPLETRDIFAVTGDSAIDKVPGRLLPQESVKIDLSAGRAVIAVSEPCAWLTLCVVRERYLPTRPEAPLSIHGPHSILVELPNECAKHQHELALEMVGNVRDALPYSVSPVVELFPHVDFGKHKAMVTLPHCLDFGDKKPDVSDVGVWHREADGKVEELRVISVTGTSATFLTALFSRFSLFSRSKTCRLNVELVPAVDWESKSVPFLYTYLRQREHGTPTRDELRDKRGFDVDSIDPIIGTYAASARFEIAVVPTEPPGIDKKHDPRVLDRREVEPRVDFRLAEFKSDGVTSWDLIVSVTEKKGANAPTVRPFEVPKSVRDNTSARSVGISVAMFVSPTAPGTDEIDRSLLQEVQTIKRLQCVSAISVKTRMGDHSICPAVPATVDEFVGDLVALATLVQRSTINDLVLLFCGHGEQAGLVCSDGNVVPVDVMATRVARCKPACVIYNVCDGQDLADVTRRLLPDCGIVFWRNKADTDTCCVLSAKMLEMVCRADVKLSLGALSEAFQGARDIMQGQHPIGGLAFISGGRGQDVDMPRATAAPSNAVGNDGSATRGRAYKGSLKLVKGRDPWVEGCWRRYFVENTAADPAAVAVAEGQFRCFFSYSFDCDAGPSRAYYFETWPNGDSEPTILVLHIHYYDEPAEDQPGLPKHVNLRRAWRIDRDTIKARAEGGDPSPVLPPAGMVGGDVKVWQSAMSQFLWDPTKDRATEKARADAALSMFEREHVYFLHLDDIDLWEESDGVCITGGPTGVIAAQRKCMNEPGWDFSAGPSPPRYPFRPAREYPGGNFVRPDVTPDDLAPVLLHAEAVRRLHPVGPADGLGMGRVAWRGGRADSDKFGEHASALANLAWQAGSGAWFCGGDDDDDSDDDVAGSGSS